MSQKKYEKDKKLGCISVHPNAVVVERKNKRTVIFKQPGEDDGSMILQLKSLIVNPEELDRPSINEEIIKNKVRVVSLGLMPSGAISIYVALGAYLNDQGLLDGLNPEMVKPEPED